MGVPSHNGSMPFDLERFVDAQDGVYESVLRELRAGRKSGHWIWFIFPQLTGLGRSEMSRFYGLASLDEARAYLDHPILGTRVRECVSAVLGTSGATADQIFGSLDAMKVRSSMTLFHSAAADEPLFVEVLERFYGGAADAETESLLAQRTSWGGPMPDAAAAVRRSRAEH
jgi:uncharacterized protein (DUF1810 family)